MTATAGPGEAVPPGRTGRRRAVLTYVLAVALPSLAAVALLVFGASAEELRGDGRVPPDRTAQLLVSVVVVILVARLFGLLARSVGQPAVIGEIIAGLCLGPSCLGLVAPWLAEWLFPAELRPVLDGFAQLGLIALMFTVGREVGDTPLRGQGVLATTVAHASLAGPFLGGVLLALPLFPGWAGPRAEPLTFALFLGSALSITAFPVLARILAETGMLRCAVGRLSLMSAAAADATTWCLVAVVTAAAGHGSAVDAVRTVVLTIGLGAVLVMWGRHRLERFFAGLDRRDAPIGVRVGCVLTGLILASASTAAIGIHPIFGAFLFGLVCPVGPAVEPVLGAVSRSAGAVLLPFFFVGTGLRTDVWQVGPDLTMLGVTVLVVLIAVLGKTAGPYAVARSAAMTRPDAVRLAVLLNTRGLTEIVLLNLGVSLGLLNDRMFLVLLAMALVTTVSTPPLLSLVDRRSPRSAGSAPDRASGGVSAAGADRAAGR